MAIAAPSTLNTEVVLQERKATSEFIIVEIIENIRHRTLSVAIEFGPFSSVPGPEDGRPIQKGSGGHRFNVWVGDAYEQVRDTWTNADLIAAVIEKMEQMPN